MGKFICVGLNYADHAAESACRSRRSRCCSPSDQRAGRLQRRRRAAAGLGQDRLGGRARRRHRHAGALRREADALKYVAGYCVVNDVSEREYQLERGGTWDKGKGCDTFGPVGPWMVTADEVPDPQALAMWLDVNGQRMQNGSTSTMIFGVASW
jgi:2,4-diketo-3-deoxy-L-fuconate hydrolase